MIRKKVAPSMPHLRSDNSLNGNGRLPGLSGTMAILFFSAAFLFCWADKASAHYTPLSAALNFKENINLYETGFQNGSKNTGIMTLTFERPEPVSDISTASDGPHLLSEMTLPSIDSEPVEPMAMYSKISNHWRKCFLFRTEDADLARLQSQTGLMFGMGLAAAGILSVMPESISKWDMEGVTAETMLQKWWDNVSSGPVWDQDEWYLNYIMHPYDGGVYYQIARNSGYSQWDSFVYTTLMSTFFWEYGFEAFAEVPSIQDLIVTPVGGWLYGEWAFRAENAIKSNDYRLIGSKWLGYTSVFLLDPINCIAEGINSVTGHEWIITGSFAFIGPSYGNSPNVIGPVSINPQMHISFHREF